MRQAHRRLRSARLRVAGLLVCVAVGAVLVWQGAHERRVAGAVRHARVCTGTSTRGCIRRLHGVVESVVWPVPGKAGYLMPNQRGAGNIEPQVDVRLHGGRTIALDTGFVNLPTAGSSVTVDYYEGYLLRARRSDGKLMAVTWSPGSWKLHLLVGAALIGAAAGLALRYVRRSPGRR